MPQISLYIDKETLQQVEKAAQAEQLSISKWVCKEIRKSLITNYPVYFKNLYGSIQDDSFTEPEELKSVQR